ncbi:HAD-IA family hydrolase [Limnobaculum xujianqingii]|uniref:HAD-IA family hydrolase n=1 Tax=Limnobaculum xujianqingii TaxID=2738837 RepID=UPI0015BBE01A|nr:HAD-IA family hydrolase [Limnobaculum xujianqingii]
MNQPQVISSPNVPKIILFDLLTALIDSWQVWNETAGSEELGKKWRMTYLKLTYGCGAYRPYETLVEEAAVASGLERSLARQLDENWKNLQPWSEAASVLRLLKQDYQLGVVTNCSERLGHMAAEQVGVPFDIVVTSDRAGFYKPDPRPYQLALDLAGVTAKEAIFVAGSAYDLIGTAKVGIPTFWHNRIGLKAPEQAPLPIEEMPTLNDLPAAIGKYIG